MLNRREFLGLVGAAASVPAADLRGSQASEWGSPVFDLHFHMRAQPAANIAHLDGAGIPIRRSSGMPTRSGRM